MRETRLVRRLFAMLLPCWFVCSSAHADNSVHVQVAAASCPSAEQLREVLAPLLSGETSLVFDTPDSLVMPRVRVIDQGAQYTVAIDDRQREIDDAARNCTERARVASVFIALNVNANALTATSTPSPTPEPAPPPIDEGPQFGLFVFGAAASSTELATVAAGGGLGASLSIDAFRVQLSAELFVPSDITLTPTGDTQGSVELLRVPLSVSVSYLLRTGWLEVGPALGLTFDGLRMRGVNVDRPQTETRMNPGLLVAFDARLSLSDAWFVLVRLNTNIFPRAYQLKVEPTGALGQTPQLWLSGNLGIEWQFR